MPTLAFVNHRTSALWQPTGLALTALLLLGYDVWPNGGDEFASQERESNRE